MATKVVGSTSELKVSSPATIATLTASNGAKLTMFTYEKRHPKVIIPEGLRRPYYTEILATMLADGNVLGILKGKDFVVADIGLASSYRDSRDFDSSLLLRNVEVFLINKEGKLVYDRDFPYRDTKSTMPDSSNSREDRVLYIPGKYDVSLEVHSDADFMDKGARFTMRANLSNWSQVVVCISEEGIPIKDQKPKVKELGQLQRVA